MNKPLYGRVVNREETEVVCSFPAKSTAMVLEVLNPKT